MPEQVPDAAERAAEFASLLIDYENASFACGAHGDDEDPPYDEVHNLCIDAKKRLNAWCDRLLAERAALPAELGLAKLRADAAESTRDVAITRAERLEARNKELEAEPTILLAELALAHGRIQRQERTLIEAEAQVAALTREALKYAHHTSACMFVLSGKCNCGLAAFLAALSAPASEKQIPRAAPSPDPLTARMNHMLASRATESTGGDVRDGAPSPDSRAPAAEEAK